MKREKYLEIEGKKIYVEIHGSDELPKMLYLHGGPGSGSYDLAHYQSSLLSDCVQLICIDQRGTLRSEELGEEDTLNLEILVEDCEMIRKKLNISRWSILSHSFGSIIAILYAKKYPDSIEKLIYSCPTFDLDDSSKSLLKGAIKEYEKEKNQEMIDKCLECINGEQTAKETWMMFTELTNALEESRQNLYMKSIDGSIFEGIYQNASFPIDDMWNKQYSFQRKIYEDEKVFQSYVSVLSEIKHPSLMIKGRFDWVTSKKQIEKYLQSNKDNKIKIMEKSSHFPQFEEKITFSEEIRKFLT